MSLYVGLVHHPIKNKRNELVTTSVTNMDVHDISRSCKTFGVKKYFIVTPLELQHHLVSKILGHWKRDENGAYNPDRQNALSETELSRSVEESIEKITDIEGKAPKVVVTGAQYNDYSITCQNLKKQILLDETPIFLLFGTGWGLHASLVEKADLVLDPIYGSGDYNHLSVRSAVAIYLDRLTNG